MPWKVQGGGPWGGGGGNAGGPWGNGSGNSSGGGGSRPQPPDIEEMLPLERVINIKDAAFRNDYEKKVTQPRSSESLIKTSFDYLLIHMSTSKDITKRRSDPIEDTNDGIYHFNIGSDTGLLKNMSFKRANSKGLSQIAELRSFEAEEDGERQLGQLKFPYNTDLKLIGSSLFMPGMYYYVV